MATSENELICDLAQYYQILDYQALPVKLVAILSVGLPKDSRVMRKQCGQSITLIELLLAANCDYWSTYLYSMTDKKHKQPQSLVASLTGSEQKKEHDFVSFRSADDYERERNKILKKMGKEGN